MAFSNNYISTHPWITFELNMKKSHPRVWILIGKAMQGCSMIRESAADPAFAANILSERLAEAVKGNSRLEGVSLSAERIDRILEADRSELDATVRDIRESGRSEEGAEGEEIFIINILRLYLFLSEELTGLREKPDIKAEGIAGINQILYRGVRTKSGAEPGSFRRADLEIDGYRGVSPAECRKLVARLTRGIAESRESFPAGDEVASGLIRAFIAHRYLTWILPFEAGNAITARFAELQIMLAAGVPEEAAIYLAGYYSRTHAEYRDLLYGERKQSVFDFMEYCLRGIVEGIESLAGRAERSRSPAVWSSSLDRLFEGERDEIAGRRKLLATAILGYGSGVTPRQVRYVAPEVTLCYADRSDKTISRDISALIELGVLRRDGRKIAANRKIILPFRDRTRDQ